MKCSSILASTICLGLFMLSCSTASGQFREDETVKQSIAVLNEIMAIPASGIPQSMLHDAQAVAIIPNVIKGSFIIGARRGDGVVLVRDDSGGWHAPVFISLTGGNIGWQIGVQSTDVVLVFKTRASVKGLLSGRMTLGADAAVAAGPIGRQATAATDTNLGAQIYSYSRSRGLFAGVSFDGSVIRLNSMNNAAYYKAATPGGPVIIPPSAKQLTVEVIRYTGNQTVPMAQVPAMQTAAPVLSAAPAPVLATAPAPVLSTATPTVLSTAPAPATSWVGAGQTVLAQQHSMKEVDLLRSQLARLAPELYELLDAHWKQYLALPAQIFQENGHPSLDALAQSMAHFDEVKTDPRYSALANHPEFQSTYGLLRHYIQVLSNTSQPLNLPAPPARQ